MAIDGFSEVDFRDVSPKYFVFYSIDF